MHEILNPQESTLDFTLHSRSYTPTSKNVSSVRSNDCRVRQHEKLTRRRQGGRTYAPQVLQRHPFNFTRDPEQQEDIDEDEESIQLVPDQGDVSCSKRVVSFNSSVRILEIPGRSQLSEREKKAMWYTTEEEDDMIEDRCDDISALISNREITKIRGSRATSPTTTTESKGIDRAGDPPCGGGADTSCIDGLFTPMEYKISKRVVEEAQYEVFFEQRMQWDNNMADPDQLADIYFENTYQNQRQALERGRCLADEVRRDENFIISEEDNTENEASATMDIDVARMPLCTSATSTSIDARSVGFTKARSVFATRGNTSLPSFFTAVNSAFNDAMGLSPLDGVETKKKTKKEKSNGTTRRRRIIREAIEIVTTTSSPAVNLREGGDDEDCSSLCSFSLMSSLGNDSFMTKWDSNSSIGDSAPCAPQRRTSSLRKEQEWE